MGSALYRGHEPLYRFRLFETNNPDELRDRLAPLYSVSAIEVSRTKSRFAARLNHRTLNEVGLSYVRYGAPVRVITSETDFFTQGFGLHRPGEAITDGRIGKVAPKRGEPNALIGNRAEFANVFLKIAPEAINRKLAALLGSPVGRPLEFSGEYDSSALVTQFRVLSYVISEIDQSMDALQPVLLREFEQSLIIAHLCANRNNYSSLLNAKPSEDSPWQVQRAIDYIDANWQQPLTIEALASATSTSARSLFAAFRRSRGCSPMAYVRHVRLLRARQLLSQPKPGTTVTSVALECGFHNHGHFAMRYRAHFGERHLETLRRGRRR